MNHQVNWTKYINYVLIAYAFCFPISKAGTNLFETMALLFWVLEGNWKEKLHLYKTNLLSISIILLVGFSLLSILWHENTGTTLKYVAKYRHLLIIFVFYSSFDKKYISYLISAFLAAMFISEIVSYAIFFEFIHYKNILPSDPTPFMSHMTYSTVLAFTVNVLLVRFFYEKNLKYKLFYIFFFLTATTNLFINGGRTGQIIFIVLIFITIFASIQHKLKAFIFSISILSLAFVLAYNFSPNFHTRADLLYTGLYNAIVHHNYKESGGTRIALSLLGIDTFLDHPIAGTGIAYSMDNIDYYASKHNFDTSFYKQFADYHNTFLTISVQLGIVGLLISCLIIYSLLTFKIENKELKLISLLFAVSFILFSISHNTLHTMNPMIYFSLFAGVFNALSKYKTT